MKTIKQKKLTGRPEIDKYLTASTGLREMVYIPKEMSPSMFDGYTEFISFLAYYVKPKLPAEQLYEILSANYEESEYLDIPTVALVLIEADIKLDYYINSEDIYKVCQIAQKGYGLDKLINHKHPKVRACVADQGYGLEILANDKNTEVRLTVVEKGYNPESFLNDTSKAVRDEAKRQIKKKYKKNNEVKNAFPIPRINAKSFGN